MQSQVPSPGGGRQKIKEWTDLKRRCAALICALTLCAGLALPASAANFIDVAKGSWYESAVNEVVDQGLMEGVSDTLFSPNATVTRSTVAVVLWRMEGEPTPVWRGHFPDVPINSWYGIAADWACEARIINGTDKGTFSDGPVTRQELAVMLSRYDTYKGRDMAEGALNLYNDANQVASWAKEGVAHAIGMGWLEGSNGKLSPKGTTTRAQLAVILERMNTQAMG